MNRRTVALVVVGVVVTLILAGFASYYASGAPDGLDKVAGDHGFAENEKAHPLDDSPVAGYRTRGLGDRLGGGVAGVAGVVLTFAAAGALVVAVRRRSAGPADAAPGPDRGAGPDHPPT